MAHTSVRDPQQVDRKAQLRLEYLPLASLRPAARNPKKHQVETVRASMGRFGYVAPMILNESTGRLVAGHGRIESLRKAKAEGKAPPSRIRIHNGDWLVPVVRGVAFTDDREAEAYLLADNQTTILGGWNDDELQEIINSLGVEDALAGTGFEDMFEDGLEQDDPTDLIDQAAELQKKWRTARGQLWLIGKHRLLCGDSTSESDVRRLMNGKRACLFAHRPAVSGGLRRNQPSAPVDEEPRPQASRRQGLVGQVHRCRQPRAGRETLRRIRAGRRPACPNA